MCGIAGFTGADCAEMSRKARAILAHRGPDGSGVFNTPGGEASLAHVRLSILDLSDAAAQPMSSEDGAQTIVYNGEIYNYRELRSSLERRGCRFKSSGDTEVLLKGLQEKGEDFLGELNGIFAFALWDSRDRSITLCRDPIGVKPLYYSEKAGGGLAFASEIKALFADQGVPRKPRPETLVQHMAYSHAADLNTAFDGIMRLEQGSILKWSAESGRIERRKFSRGSANKGENAADTVDRDSAVERLRALLRAACTRQLVSDVRVGSLLSGGLDSSLITALCAPEAREGFEAFTIVYPPGENSLDQAHDDAPHARDMALSLGLKLHEIEIKPEVTGLLPLLIRHLDEPLADPAAISCYLICRQARELGATVLLSGQGGDELFCGYPRYWVMDSTAWAGRLPGPVRRTAAFLGKMLPGAMEGRAGAAARRVRRGLSELGRDYDSRFLSYCANTPEMEIAKVLSSAFMDSLNGRGFMDADVERMRGSGLSGINRLRDRDMYSYLPNHNLNYTDKMSMACGVEVRVPLLDLDIVDACLGFPPKWLVSGRNTKAILKDAARGLVPDPIIDRPKAGFGAPYRKWLRYDLSALWDDVMSETAVKRRGWFDFRALQDARSRSQSGSADLYMLQWAVLTIEIWAREFLD